MQTVTTIDLEHEQLLVLDGPRRGRVRVLHGAAWLTEDAEAGDVVLCAGSEHVSRGGRTLIEALGASQVQIELAPASPARRFAQWLGSVVQGAQAAVARLQMGPAPSL